MDLTPYFRELVSGNHGWKVSPDPSSSYPRHVLFDVLRYEVFTAETMIAWVLTPCRLVRICQKSEEHALSIFRGEY
jgi:hypothetical protein